MPIPLPPNKLPSIKPFTSNSKETLKALVSDIRWKQLDENKKLEAINQAMPSMQNEDLETQKAFKNKLEQEFLKEQQKPKSYGVSGKWEEEKPYKSSLLSLFTPPTSFGVGSGIAQQLTPERQKQSLEFAKQMTGIYPEKPTGKKGGLAELLKGIKYFPVRGTPAALTTPFIKGKPEGYWEQAKKPTETYAEAIGSNWADIILGGIPKLISKIPIPKKIPVSEEFNMDLVKIANKYNIKIPAIDLKNNQTIRTLKNSLSTFFGALGQREKNAKKLYEQLQREFSPIISPYGKETNLNQFTNDLINYTVNFTTKIEKGAERKTSAILEKLKELKESGISAVEKENIARMQQYEKQVGKQSLKTVVENLKLMKQYDREYESAIQEGQNLIKESFKPTLGKKEEVTIQLINKITGVNNRIKQTFNKRYDTFFNEISGVDDRPLNSENLERISNLSNELKARLGDLEPPGWKKIKTTLEGIEEGEESFSFKQLKEFKTDLFNFITSQGGKTGFYGKGREITVPASKLENIIDDEIGNFLQGTGQEEIYSKIIQDYRKYKNLFFDEKGYVQGLIFAKEPVSKLVSPSFGVSTAVQALGRPYINLFRQPQVAELFKGFETKTPEQLRKIIVNKYDILAKLWGKEPVDDILKKLPVLPEKPSLIPEILSEKPEVIPMPQFIQPSESKILSKIKERKTSQEIGKIQKLLPNVPSAQIEGLITEISKMDIGKTPSENVIKSILVPGNPNRLKIAMKFLPENSINNLKNYLINDLSKVNEKGFVNISDNFLNAKNQYGEQNLKILFKDAYKNIEDLSKIQNRILGLDDYIKENLKMGTRFLNWTLTGIAVSMGALMSKSKIGGAIATATGMPFAFNRLTTWWNRPANTKKLLQAAQTELDAPAGKHLFNEINNSLLKAGVINKALTLPSKSLLQTLQENNKQKQPSYQEAGYGIRY